MSLNFIPSVKGFHGFYTKKQHDIINVFITITQAD